MAHNQRLNAWYYLLRTTLPKDLINADIAPFEYSDGSASVHFNNEDDAWLDESSAQHPLPTQLPLPF